MDSVEQSEGIKVTFKDFIKKYLKYWPLFVVSVAAALAVAYIYLRYATPVYNASATLLIKSENTPYGTANEEFESIFLYKGGNDVDNEIEVLKSKSLAKRVVNSLGLQSMYYTVGNVKTSLLYPGAPFRIKLLKIADTSENTVLNVKLISGNQFTIGDSKQVFNANTSFAIPEGMFELQMRDTLFGRLQYKDYVVELLTDESAVQTVLDGLKVAPIKDRSNVLLLTFQGVHPELARDILNDLMVQYKNASIEDKNQIALQTNNFINKRLDIIADELGAVETNLKDFRQKNQVINADIQSELFLTNQSEQEKQLAETEVKLSIIKYLQDYLIDDANKYSIVPSSLGIEDPVFMQLVKSYNELQLRRESELKTTTVQNPIIKALDVQFEKLRADMRENLRNLHASAKLVRDQSVNKIKRFESSISSIPVKEKNLLDITRQQGIKQTLYLYLLQKREETAISLASTISNSQVLDTATAARQPIKPSAGGIKGIAIFLGLLIPAVLIYLRELLNDKLSGRQDINRITQAPIFGEIGHSDSGTALVVKKSSRNVISEQFRMIRTNMQYLVGRDKPVILVTSTFSGEGKSFVSINVGAVMALAGKKTVIIEFDIRKPKIVAGLGLEKSPGITNYLVGGHSLENLPVAVPQVDNLYVVPCGAIPPNPAELLLDEKLPMIFEYLRKNFDVIIIDTAPVGLVSDAQVLSRYANSTLYIVRLNHTFKKHIHFLDDLYSNNKLPRLGVLVNDINASSDYYSYGNYNGYGYGYSYFEETGVRPKRGLKRYFSK